MRMIKLFIISSLFVFISGCATLFVNQDCLDNIISEQSSRNLNKRLISEFRDSIREWSRGKLRGAAYLNNNKSLWKIDALLTNSSSDRMFGWILMIDRDIEAKLDFVKYFAGEKRGTKWYFYIHNVEFVYYARENNNDKRYTFEQLSQSAREQVVKGGILKAFTCELDDDYINGWIDMEGMNLYEKHERFLRDTVRYN